MRSTPAWPIERTGKRFLRGLRPGLAAIRRAQINVGKLQTRKVALRVFRINSHLLEEVDGAGASFQWARGLFESDHQALVRHLPGADPTRISGRLWRVINRLARQLAADQ